MAIQNLSAAKRVKNQGIPKQGRLSLPSAMPNLSLIGVPESMQDRAPGIMSYPDKFNPNARVLWKQMFEDTVFKDNLRAEEDVSIQWHRSIMEFLRLCEMYGATPFTPITNQEQNDTVITSLTHARRALKVFCDGVGLFDRLKIFEACREYKIRERGTAIHAWANVRPIRDPYFEKWLTQAPLPRFTLSTNNRYIRMVQPNVALWVRFVNRTRITVGFEIHIAATISVPGKRLPTRKDIDTYIDRVIWKPIVRAQRFAGVKSRLF